MMDSPDLEDVSIGALAAFAFDLARPGGSLDSSGKDLIGFADENLIAIPRYFRSAAELLITESTIDRESDAPQEFREHVHKTLGVPTDAQRLEQFRSASDLLLTSAQILDLRR